MQQQRWRCLVCRKTATEYAAGVVPRHRYAEDVIKRRLELRQTGRSWERAAEECTAEGQLEASVLKRWCRRFRIAAGRLSWIPPVTPLARPRGGPMLRVPVGSRSPDHRHEDHWERGPPPLSLD